MRWRRQTACSSVSVHKTSSAMIVLVLRESFKHSNLVLLRGWEHDTENAALPKLALQFNSSALVLDRPLRDGQPQAVSAVGPGTGSVHSVETVGDFCLMIRRVAR